MAHRELLVALSVIVATAAVASQPESIPPTDAPAGGPDTRYCMRVELTGNVIQPIRCWTREEWADEGVNVDKEWAKEGVAVKE